LRSALFLDRDGTINVDTIHVSNAANVRLLPGAAEAIARINAVQLPVIVISNQSGIGRGLFTVDDYESVRARIDEMLAAAGARLLTTYYCPHSPDVAPVCECRKPGPALYRQAAAEHAIDLARSWYVGDRLRDIQPAKTFGGRGILVPRDTTPGVNVVAARDGFAISTSLSAAVDRILSSLPLSTPPGDG
ncbi:MAG: HAD family hydrolase, partial [Gemmatimonadaceae bacterium]|nr:HAD family hydrolase [Gemmatimonadaceae bacterium]